MKQKLVSIFIIILFASATKAQAQLPENNYQKDSISYPETTDIVTSFHVNDNNIVFLALNGGIYLPHDSLWFIPPSKNFYFTAFAPNVKDTSLFVVANTTGNSELYYLKSSIQSPIKRFLVATLEKGIYNLIFKANVCYVWGYCSNISRIGILVNGEVKWLLQLQGVIKQVQVNNDGDIFFTKNNSIFQLGSPKPILTLEKKIFGFDFDKQNNIIVSSMDGVGISIKDKLEFITSEAAGPVQYNHKSAFILNRNKNNIIQLSFR